ncbi:MAG: tryptophan--tRNA ligase [Nanoarchaeota archaeon]
MPIQLTPWGVSGEIEKADYLRLIKEFGTQPLNERLLERLKKHTRDLHFMLRRGIFFSHRDFDWILDNVEKGREFYLYTGRGPSGNTHVGHLVPWMLTKWLQEKFHCKFYFQLTDDEKFFYNEHLSLEDTKKYAYENALDLIALGFEHKNTKLIIDTEYIKELYPLAAKVAKKLTYSTVKASFGFKDSTNVGLIFFTSLQSAPCFLESVKEGKNIPCLIPHAIDQDPHFRITRDIAPKIGFFKPAAIHNKFLPGLGKEGKMSASQPETAIFTTDNPNEARKKIMRAYSGGAKTLAEHKEKGGNPEVDVACQYLLFLFEEDDKKVEDIFEDYKAGSIGSKEVKHYLADKVERFLKEHQLKREKSRKVLDKFILRD